MSNFQSSLTTAIPHAEIKQSIHFQNGSTFEHAESTFWSKQFALSSKSPSDNDSKDPTKSRYMAKHTAISAKSNFPINSISFRPSDPEDTKSTNKQMAVATGPRVSLYPLKPSSALSWGSDVQPDRNISLGDVAYCTDYRADGRLLVIGCADGSIRVVDIKTRATLRTFRASSKDSSAIGIRSVLWGRDGKKIVSAGDDAILRIWDISGEDADKPLLQLKGHADTIRVCKMVKVPSLAPSNTDKSSSGGHATGSILAVTGSYDHTLRLWDFSKLFYPSEKTGVDTDNYVDDCCLSVMDHGAPVEDIIILNNSYDKKDNSSLLVLSAGGTMMKLWNAMTGTLLTSITSHAKTITTMCIVSSQQLRPRRGNQNIANDNEIDKLPRLITGGLDGLLRIHSLTIDPSHDHYSIKVLHGIKHKSPITTIHMSPDAMRLIIGTTDGILSIFHRTRAQQHHEHKQQKQQDLKRKRLNPRGGTYAYFMRGTDAMPDPDDYQMISEKKKKMNRFDAALRQFRYADALDEALRTKNPLVVASTLEELSKRRGLTIALSSRDEETLEPLLSFITRYIAHPKYSNLLTGVSNLLCNIYASVMGQSALIDELFRKLRRHVQKEIGFQKDLLKMMGQIDSYLFQTETATHRSKLGHEEEHANK